MNERIVKRTLDLPVTVITIGFLALFCVLALVNAELVKSLVNGGFAWSIKYFGAYWQVLLLLTFLIGLFIALGSTGRVKLGALERPELSNFKWTAIIMCTLLAGGGVFWAAAEPIAHFVSVPPTFDAPADDFEKAVNALTQSYMHWGFLAWAILGVLTSIVLMHLHYDKGLPLKPRTLLYPVFGDAVNGPLGTIVDAVCLIAVAAGTIGPIGFLGLQISFALNSLFSIPDVFYTQFTVILIAVVIYIISALSGLHRGIQILSRYNVILAIGLMIYILIFGPTGFIINAYIHGVGNVIDNFISLATFRANEGWLGWWTVFFWGWFLGYGPVMAVFISRISRGRSIRQLVLTISVVAPLVTMFWFTIVGGAGLSHEIANPGTVSKAFEGFNLPGALLAITATLPLSDFISLLFLVLTTIFIVTTGDSITYTMSTIVTGDTDPNPIVRIFLGITMGAVAIILISLGSGGISALQSFIVVTAVPVSLVLLPSLWNGPKIAMEMAKNQNV